ncbi:MAG TPA: hypothetical protein VI410_09510, partial [Anaerolineales bacterium]|nr:hypothetical protein [Anaerolineales bacterium]
MGILSKWLAALALVAMLVAACAPATAEPPGVAPAEETPPEGAATEPAAPIEEPTAAVDPTRSLDLILVQHALCAWDSFWCTVERGITDAADDLGVNVTVLGPDEFDLEQTASL